jgi:hypothetical protein
MANSVRTAGRPAARPAPKKSYRVAFKKVEYQSQSGDYDFDPLLDDEGNPLTFNQALDGRFIKFTRKNLRGDKRVTILMSDDQKDFSNAEMITCQKPLSELIRTALANKTPQKVVLSNLLNLTIDAKFDEDGQLVSAFLRLPSDGDVEMLESFSAEDLAQESYENLW